VPSINLIETHSFVKGEASGSSGFIRRNMARRVPQFAIVMGSFGGKGTGKNRARYDPPEYIKPAEKERARKKRVEISRVIRRASSASREASEEYILGACR